MRGWLCGGCNKAEGRASTKAPRYVNYRARNPASILGVEIPYTSSWARTVPTAAQGMLADDYRRITTRYNDLAQAGGDPAALIEELKQLCDRLAHHTGITA